MEFMIGACLISLAISFLIGFIIYLSNGSDRYAFNFAFSLGFSVWGILLALFLTFGLDIRTKDFDAIYSNIELFCKSEVTNDELKDEIERLIQKETPKKCFDMDISIKDDYQKHGVVKRVKVKYKSEVIGEFLYNGFNSLDFQIIISDKVDIYTRVVH